MPEFRLADCQIIVAESRDYTDKSGNARTFKSLTFSYDGGLFRLPVAKDLDFKPNDLHMKNCTLVVGLSTFGDNLTPSLRVIDIE